MDWQDREAACPLARSPGPSSPSSWSCRVARRHFLLAFRVGRRAGPGGGTDRRRAGAQRGEVPKLVRQLDSDRFDVREKAASRLQELVGKPELQQCLAEEFERVLVRADVSFEVRWQLNRWMRQLPAALPGPAAADRPSGEQLDALVRQLDNDRYAARAGAAYRLEWLLKDPKFACPLLVRLKRASPRKRSASRPGSGSRRRSTARRAWLSSDPAGWDLPPVSDEQINVWLSDLSRPLPAGAAAGAQIKRDAAERELFDLLPRNPYVPRSKGDWRRFAQRPAPAAAAQLTSLLSWTKPALAVEIWSNRKNRAENYTIVGEPLILPNAAKPIQFGPVNGQVAHCLIARRGHAGARIIRSARPFRTRLPRAISTTWCTCPPPARAWPGCTRRRRRAAAAGRHFPPDAWPRAGGKTPLEQPELPADARGPRPDGSFAVRRQVFPVGR